MTKPQGPPTDDNAKLPHDRDESPTPGGEDRNEQRNRGVIQQAHDDAESGQQDTERIGIPSNVPTKEKGSA